MVRGIVNGILSKTTLLKVKSSQVKVLFMYRLDFPGKT